MDQESAKIKFEEHFKLHVPFKDKILLESELYKNGIDFYFEENQPLLSQGIRYFLRDRDRPEIDRIIIENQIIAGTETIPVNDYRDQQKVQKLNLVITCIIIGILLVISAINLFAD